jgi:simple sugar transport system ATP-binding protein
MGTIAKLEGITKRFGSLVANDSVEFSVEEGEIHALIGENGAGKTTLMRILNGQYKPDEGNIFVDGIKTTYNISGAMKLGIGMVHQNFMQIPKMSILENIILGRGPQKKVFIDYKTESVKIKELLYKFGMKTPLGTPIGLLSVGERQKIEIIKSLYLGARLLILDEPTAVLTPQETDGLFTIIQNLKKENKSIIFISHKLKEVVAIGDRITVMRKGQIVALFKKGEVNETDIAEAMIGKQNLKQIGGLKNSNIGRTVLEVKNMWYFNDEGIPKLKNFSIEVKQGEILGIGGVEGNGQTELTNLLIGTLQPVNGSIILDGNDITSTSIRKRRDLGMGYIPEDRMTEGLALDADIEDNLICGAENKHPFNHYMILLKGEITSYAHQLINKFDIRGVNKGQPIKSLSGGNLQKIVLARELSRSPKILIASQVTRGLDIGATIFVHNHLIEQKSNGIGIIMVSADLDELISLSDRIIIMYEGASNGEITDVSRITEAQIGLMMGGISHSAEAQKVNW